MECFMCHKLGHFAARCPEKTVEIHHVDVGPVYTTDAKVGGKPSTVILDSGARRSMFPPKLIEPKEYTGSRIVAVGAVGEATLETADVIVEVGDWASELQVLVQPDRENAFLGQTSQSIRT